MERGIAVHVEEWLSTITRSRGTKAKIRNIMSAICTHAIRYGWMTTNPIRSVRRSAKTRTRQSPVDGGGASEALCRIEAARADPRSSRRSHGDEKGRIAGNKVVRYRLREEDLEYPKVDLATARGARPSDRGHATLRGSIPSFFRREISVVRLMSMRAAAPSGPPTRPFVTFRMRTISSRSSASRVPASGAFLPL